MIYFIDFNNYCIMLNYIKLYLLLNNCGIIYFLIYISIFDIFCVYIYVLKFY